MTTITYNPSPGTHIDKACHSAVNIATAIKFPVQFNFNGIPVTVNPGDSAEDIAARWNRDMKAESERYRNSPEGIEAARKAEQRAEESRLGIASLMERLPSVVGNLSDTVMWCRGLSNCAHIDAPFDHELVASTLESAGYVRNEYVGHEPKIDFDTDPVILGRWIIGQAIECLRMGMPPHGVINKFVDEYLKLVEK